MTIFHFLTSVSWKNRPQLLSVDTSPAVGTSVMASEPLGETSPMVRLLAGTSHCANLARKQIDLCQLELFSTCSPSSRSSRQTGQVASSPLFTLLLTTQPSTWGENCLIWKTTNTNTEINQKKQNTNIKIDQKDTNTKINLLFCPPCSSWQPPLAHLLHDRPAKKDNLFNFNSNILFAYLV